jgi:hypothetical protein
LDKVRGYIDAGVAEGAKLLVDGRGFKMQVCTECSRPLELGYLHDLSTSKRYCGIECYPQWMVVSGFVGSIAPATPFELAVAWPKLTVDVASALFDSAWSDQGV